MRKVQLHFCVFLLAVSPYTLQAAGLKAGVAKVDITPPLGLPMWGYFDRKTPSKAVLDPLYSRVLVLEAGDTRLALVALDLGRTFGPASLERLREAVKKSSGISCLLVAASHTHAGPVIQDDYPSGDQPDWEKAVLDKVARAVGEASAHLVEAQLGVGRGSVHIGYNRIRVSTDGSVSMFWSNPTKVATGPVDPTVSVLRVDRADGKPLAVLVNYSCHPVVFGADNLQYSADFPGVMTQVVEKALAPADGSEAICFFLQGAPGDINPYYATIKVDDGAVKWRDWTGEELGREAGRVAKNIRTESVPEASIQFVEDTLIFRLRWDVEKLRQALLAAYGPDIFKNYAPRVKPQLELLVSTVLINKRIALMTMPGEPFVDFQIDWRDRCPVRDAFFLGYANGYFGYFPTIRAASLGGYGAASATTWVEVGAGERMVDHAIARVFEMLGRLSDMPEDLKK